MRITDSSNIKEQLQETVIRMNDLLGFQVPFFTILEDNNTIDPLFDITAVQENVHSAGVVEYTDWDEEHQLERIQDFLYLASAYTDAVDKIYALQDAGIRHTLIFHWDYQWCPQTLTMDYNPITETYSTHIKFE